MTEPPPPCCYTHHEGLGALEAHLQQEGAGLREVDCQLGDQVRAEPDDEALLVEVGVQAGHRGGRGEAHGEEKVGRGGEGGKGDGKGQVVIFLELMGGNAWQ